MINITLESAEYFYYMSAKLSSMGVIESALYDNATFINHHDDAYDLCEEAISLNNAVGNFNQSVGVASVSLTYDQASSVRMVFEYVNKHNIKE